jgi:hydroxyacylglutathione hydrolase
MKQLADDLYQIPGFPPNAINVYLAGGVLIDSGTRHRAGSILKALKGREVTAHALTHAHPDHQGSSRAVIDALKIPLWCGVGEADAIESGDLGACMPNTWISRSALKAFAGPPCPVARRLQAGDEVAGFTVFDAPGHSPGHIVYWRESDRILIIGDVLAGMNVLTSFPGLSDPPRFFTVDPALNRLSARKVAALEPDLVLFGHGPPWRRTAKTGAFTEAVARLLA